MIFQRLTARQQGLLSTVREEWKGIAQLTEAADRREAELGLALAYIDWYLPDRKGQPIDAVRDGT